MKVTWLAAFACTGLVYCGGGSGGGGSSGVDRNKTIADLDDGEAMDLCEYVASQLPTLREIDCGDGEPFTIGVDPAELDEQIMECTVELSNLPDCTATVGDVEECAEQSDRLSALSDDEICDIISGVVDPPDPPAACEAFEIPGCEPLEPV